MILTTITGSLPLLLTPEIISATTISGTMVLGLAPIFIFWKIPVPRLSFHLAFLTGIASGLTLLFGWLPEALYLTTGKYADLLAVNVYGTVVAVGLYFVPWFLKRN